MEIETIISGGQTGADQAGLRAARQLGIGCGGTAPWNWMTEYGPAQDLLQSFGLEAGPFDPATYPKRTVKNILNSDATIWFGNSGSPGGRLTLSRAAYWNKPFLVNPSKGDFQLFVRSPEIKILNIAGNRESKNPGITQRVVDFLVGALE